MNVSRELEILQDLLSTAAASALLFSVDRFRKALKFVELPLFVLSSSSAHFSPSNNNVLGFPMPLKRDYIANRPFVNKRIVSRRSTRQTFNIN